MIKNERQYRITQARVEEFRTPDRVLQTASERTEMGFGPRKAAGSRYRPWSPRIGGAEMVRASRSKRSRNCGLAASAAGRTLIATMRSSRVSRAL